VAILVGGIALMVLPSLDCRERTFDFVWRGAAVVVWFSRTPAWTVARFGGFDQADSENLLTPADTKNFATAVIVLVSRKKRKKRRIVNSYGAIVNTLRKVSPINNWRIRILSLRPFLFLHRTLSKGSVSGKKSNHTAMSIRQHEGQGEFRDIAEKSGRLAFWWSAMAFDHEVGTVADVGVCAEKNRAENLPQECPPDDSPIALLYHAPREASQKRAEETEVGRRIIEDAGKNTAAKIEKAGRGRAELAGVGSQPVQRRHHGHKYSDEQDGHFLDRVQRETDWRREPIPGL